MNRKLIVLGAMLLTILATTTAPVYAEVAKDTARIEKLEDRTRDLEARLAKVEASSQQQTSKMMQHEQGMMGKGMQQGKDMMDKGMGMGMNHPMGQMPQQGQQMPPQNPGMADNTPQGGSPQQGAGMPAGGAMGGDM
jgi:TolA-binding protein